MCDNNPIKEQLLGLFTNWAEAQKNESLDSYIKTCPSGMENNTSFRASFIADGCVNYESYMQSNQRLLFILKEPASLRKHSEYFGNGNLITDMESHWYKGVIEAEGNTNKRYYKKFKAICDALNVNPLNTAMMNVNKRGGYSTGTDDSVLAQYAYTYKKYILNQIRILNPDIIVSCILAKKTRDVLFAPQEKDWYEFDYSNNRKIWLYNKDFKMGNKDIKLYSMPHPAVRVSATNYKNLFISELNKH